MNQSALAFAIINLKEKDTKGKRVLEIGSAIRGSQQGNFRRIANAWGCSEYVGIDSHLGQDVDQVISVENIKNHFEDNSFDIVLCFEVLEHIQDWRAAIQNIKNICKPDGTIILTTRSEGFPYHSFPQDFWRFSIDDMKIIFQNHPINSIENDPLYPGVFISAQNNDLSNPPLNQLNIYSIIKNKRINSIQSQDLKNIRFRFSRVKDYLANKIVRGVKLLLRFNKTTLN